MLLNMRKNLVSFGPAIIALIAVVGCTQNVSETEGVEKSMALEEYSSKLEKMHSEPSKIETPKTHLVQNLPKEYYSELCGSSNYPDYEGEDLFSRSKPMKAFLQANGGGWFKFAPTVYDARADYNNDGIRDFYLTAPGYNHSSFTEDYTEFYIVLGALGASESTEPDFTKKALLFRHFSGMNRNTFLPRSSPGIALDITKEGNFIITAKATPVEFKNGIYLKIQAQFAQAGNQIYRSAYHNPPDWTTYVKINQRMELKPVC